MSDPLSDWPAFAEGVRRRLVAGGREYGNRSFSRDPAELLEEIREELMDVAGWAYVLSQRLERMRAALERR